MTASMGSASPRTVARAAEVLASADAVLFGAGAGMGVDSGLPDFRGDEGFWRAYPLLRGTGLSFVDMADPVWFERDPARAWGFYGHRLNLYRTIAPHPGFAVVREWSASRRDGVFVYTSNVDGQFQTAGVPAEAVLECHGSIHRLQCAVPCSAEIWDARDVEIDVDEQTLRARTPLPSCPRCGGVARPNILMFGDTTWLGQHTAAQTHRFRSWLDGLSGSLAVVECGAGTAVPTVRLTCERVAKARSAPFIRINPRDAVGGAVTVSLPMTALDALTAIA